MTKHHWLIAATGTGGHVFPGIAIADGALRFGVKISFIATEIPEVKKWILQAGHSLQTINFVGVRKTRIINLLTLPFRFAIALYQSIVIIRKLQPDTIICMGGYVGVPVGVAGKLLKKKIVVHEQNSIPGKANQIVAIFADLVFTGYKETKFRNFVTGKAIHKKIIFSGNPLRKEFEQKIAKHKLKKSEPQVKPVKNKQQLKVLVLGGSRGAVAITNLMFELYEFIDKQNESPLNSQNKITTALNRLNFLHQTGEANYTTALKRLAGLSKNNQEKIKVVPFLNDMGQILQNTDMVISRSGAIFLSELQAFEIPALLIPYPYAVDDHQYYNAQSMAKNGMAICVRQKDLNLSRLINCLLKEFLDAEKWLAKKFSLQSTKKFSAVNTITNHLLNIN